MNLRKIFKLSLVFLLFLCPVLVQADDIWIDVRSSEEHQVDNIKGDLLISHDAIVEEVGKLYPDHETKIYLYCRSGNRAGNAKSALNKLGYKKVFNAGSIENARKQRGLLKLD